MKKWCLAFFLQFLLIGSFYGQSLSASQHKYLEKQLVPISNDSLLKEARWKQLALHLKNKNLILIGENNHGSKEIFQWRNDLIRYLHQQEGFNAVLFESGFGELLPGQEIDLSLSPLQMIRGLFGGWRTPEFKDLMAYINSEKMDCAGIDVQRSGGGFRELLKAFCREHGVDTYSWN